MLLVRGPELGGAVGVLGGVVAPVVGGDGSVAELPGESLGESFGEFVEFYHCLLK